MKIRYRISMNRNQKSLPPWCIEDPSGKKYSVHTVLLLVPVETHWEDGGSVYKGWMIATGELVLDQVKSEAKII
jgi:hypothetical protein